MLNPEQDAIGMHCTHGINRTGYALVYLLMTRDIRKLYFLDALAMVEEARGHKITKKVLIEDLYKKFAPDDLQKVLFYNHKLLLKEYEIDFENKVQEIMNKG
jgi:hypothetical protein